MMQKLLHCYLLGLAFQETSPETFGSASKGFADDLLPEVLVRLLKNALATPQTVKIFRLGTTSSAAFRRGRAT